MDLFPEIQSQNSKDYQNSCKILAAAVINKQFREKLLSNPQSALEAGYGGQIFQINNEIKNKISIIQANNLSDFAMQLTQSLSVSFTPAPCIAGD